MNELTANISRVKYRLRWQVDCSSLKFEIQRTGFLNRHWYPFRWKLGLSPSPTELYTAAINHRGTTLLPSLFIRTLGRLTGLRFVLNLGVLPAISELETLDAFLGRKGESDFIVFRSRSPGFTAVCEMPLELLKNMAEQSSAGYPPQSVGSPDP